MSDKKSAKIRALDIVWLVAGAFVLAFGLYNVHAQSSVTEGGVLGLALLFEHHFSVSPALSSLIINALCYIFGAIMLGWGFIWRSALSAALFSVFYAVFEIFPPVYPEISRFPIVCAIVGAMFVGIGVGLCVRAGGAPTGDDALAMGVLHIVKVKIQYVYLVTDLTVLVLSLTYIPLAKILYSLLTVVLSGQIIGFVSRIGKK